ncbi:STAS domain-containing protein [Nonomuraea sp. NPDC049486]|uniref:STAS domain-containing protein n=1 Tax=Nonomuraea sp. NPDC049486 TaxID=3155773 RepID=UPI0034341017
MNDSALIVGVAEEHGVLVVRLAGDLSWDNMTRWRSWLDAHLATDAKMPVLIDLSALAFLDSSGLASLITAHQRLQRAGVAMAFLHPGAPVTRWLRITGLEAHLPIFDTMDAAIPAVSSPPPPAWPRP